MRGAFHHHPPVCVPGTLSSNFSLDQIGQLVGWQTCQAVAGTSGSFGRILSQAADGMANWIPNAASTLAGGIEQPGNKCLGGYTFFQELILVFCADPIEGKQIRYFPNTSHHPLLAVGVCIFRIGSVVIRRGGLRVFKCLKPGVKEFKLCQSRQSIVPLAPGLCVSLAPMSVPLAPIL